MAEVSNPFAAPSEFSNVVLIVEGQKLHVNKEYLSVHSPALAAIFAENGKDEVDLKDVVYEEFIDLLNLLYLVTTEITDYTLFNILLHSHRFQIERVLNHTEKYLAWSNRCDIMIKLLYADWYGLESLRDHCLLSFTSVADLTTQLKAFSDYDSLSNATKTAICDRMRELGSKKSSRNFSSPLRNYFNWFDGPTQFSNVILIIDGKKVHVTKEYLAIHSPVFSAMFFGEFAENGKEEVEIKDVVYEEFLDLLNLIYLWTMEITSLTIMHILKLSDRFQMERVLSQAENHLIQSKGFDTMKKLLLADQYRLVHLRNHCLLSFTKSTDLAGKLKSFPEYSTLSDTTKISICDRMKELGTVPSPARTGSTLSGSRVVRHQSRCSIS